MTQENTTPNREQLLELQKQYGYNDSETFGTYSVDAKIGRNYFFHALRNEDGSIYATVLKREGPNGAMVTANGQLSAPILSKGQTPERLETMRKKVKSIDEDPDAIVCTFHNWVVGADFYLTDWYDATIKDIAPLVKVVQECGKWSETKLPASVVTEAENTKGFTDATEVIE